MLRRGGGRFRLPVLLLALLIVLYWKITLTRQYTWLPSPQAATQLAPHWLVWAMPRHHSWVERMNWYFVLLHFAAALFASLLLKDLKLSNAAAILGALVYAEGPFMGTSESPAVLFAAVWIPFVLLFFLRFLGNRKRAQSGAFCAAALAVWFVSLPRTGRPPIDQWLANSIQPLSIGGLVIPGFGDPLLFAGWTALTLALIGLWNNFDSTAARIAAGLAAVGLILPFGRFVFLSGSLYGLNILASDPRAALILLALGLSILAAMGLDAVRAVPIPRVPAALALIGGAFFVTAFLLALTQGGDLRRFTPIALSGLTALLLALYLRVRPNPVWAIVLLVWELGHVIGMKWIDSDLK